MRTCDLLAKLALINNNDACIYTYQSRRRVQRFQSGSVRAAMANCHLAGQPLTSINLEADYNDLSAQGMRPRV